MHATLDLDDDTLDLDDDIFQRSLSKVSWHVIGVCRGGWCSKSGKGSLVGKCTTTPGGYRGLPPVRPTTLFCFAVVLGSEPTLRRLRSALHRCHAWQLFSSFTDTSKGIAQAFPASLLKSSTENAPEFHATWSIVARCLARNNTTSLASGRDAIHYGVGESSPCGWLDDRKRSVNWVVKVDADTWLRPSVLSYMLERTDAYEPVALGTEQWAPGQPWLALLGPLQVLSIGAITRMDARRAEWPDPTRLTTRSRGTNESGRGTGGSPAAGKRVRLVEDVWIRLLLDALNVSVIHFTAPPICACRCNASGMRMPCSPQAPIGLHPRNIEALARHGAIARRALTRGNATAFLGAYPSMSGAGRLLCMAYDAPAFHALKSDEAHAVVRFAVRWRVAGGE